MFWCLESDIMSQHRGHCSDVNSYEIRHRNCLKLKMKIKKAIFWQLAGDTEHEQFLLSGNELVEEFGLFCLNRPVSNTTDMSNPRELAENQQTFWRCKTSNLGEQQLENTLVW